MAGVTSAWRTRARQTMRNGVADLIRDRRPHVPYSYGWLNTLTARLVAVHPAAEIRPAYTWGLVQAAALGRALGMPRIAALEFGVAGGRGLRALEQIAEHIEPLFGVGIDVHGFDTGAGLPPPEDPRDLPNLYAGGDYAMDVARLQPTLRRATLHLGLVRDTVGPFLASQAAPVGFISFDLDLYSGTMDALDVLRADVSGLLPRVQCYFDDILGLTFGDCNGERLAIATFTRERPDRQLSPIYGLRHYLPWPLRDASWTEMVYLAHVLDHPLYGRDDGLIGKRTAGLERE